MTKHRALVLALAFASFLPIACGSKSPTVVIPAATVTATGNGALVVHPSADNRFAVAVEVPILIKETGGGAANWDAATMSIFRNGAEIERNAIGADTIQAAGYRTISPSSSTAVVVYFHFNAQDFDSFTITLDFDDAQRGGTFTVSVPINSFTDVTSSLTPVRVPTHSIVRR